MNPNYHQRRTTLFQKLPPNSIVILKAATLKTRSKDTHYPYRQNNHFVYLTGLEEQDAVAVLIGGVNEVRMVIFCKPYDRQDEIWNGRRLGLEGALQAGAGEAHALEKFSEMLPDLLKGHDELFISFENAQKDEPLFALLSKLKNQKDASKVPRGISNLDFYIDTMRLKKEPNEIECMEKAALLSANAHLKTMQMVKPGMHEYEVEAFIEYQFAKNGLKNLAYESIVAGGENACILHYIENNALLQANDLLLIDAGGEYLNYCADITRTFPVSGKFSGPQKTIYDIVLAAQLAGIAKARPGNRFEDIQLAVLRVMVQGLIDEKILTGTLDGLIESGSYKAFYMHGSGHWLGLDVHDVGPYKTDHQSILLEPNMVLTVEPGLYFSSKERLTPPAFRSIGIRIEDDILVTDGTAKVLSAVAPKTIQEIEDAMHG